MTTASLPPIGPWPAVDQIEPLQIGDVHIWSADLRQLDGYSNGAMALITPDELQRASRFREGLNRRRWISTRSWLRIVLAHYLDCSTHCIAFKYGRNGKPFLRFSNAGLFFNLSHSGNLAVLGISDAELGIDVQAPKSHQPSFNLNLWTRREALLKASGEGLSRDPASISVAPDRAPSASSIRFDVCHGAGVYSGFQLWDLQPDHGVPGAIAVAHRIPTFRVGSWQSLRRA